MLKTLHRGCYYSQEHPGNFFETDGNWFWSRPVAYGAAYALAKTRHAQLDTDHKESRELLGRLGQAIGALTESDEDYCEPDGESEEPPANWGSLRCPECAIRFTHFRPAVCPYCKVSAFPVVYDERGIDVTLAPPAAPA